MEKLKMKETLNLSVNLNGELTATIDNIKHFPVDGLCLEQKSIVPYQEINNDMILFYMTERKTHPSERGWDVSDH
jgi:hypothetical protein